ncbi:MAG: nitrile hydratase accessory protein [Pseudomonadota bacterium]
MNPSDVSTRLATLLPEDIIDDQGPVFAEPWQAQAFAMTVELIQQHIISWPEWADAIGYQIAHAHNNGYAENGSDYYHLWVRALENLVTGRGLVSQEELSTVKNAWHEAYIRTPHGEPVSISDD